MKIIILTVGKIKEKFYTEAVNEYLSGFLDTQGRGGTGGG